MNGWPASIDSKRPGTPPTDSIPRADRVAVDSERLRAARAAPIAFSRLKAPAELQLDPVDRVRAGIEGDGVGEARGEPSAPLAGDVDDRAVGRREERGLRLEVGLHRPVEVEVVLGEVREDEDGEAGAVEPALRLGLGGRLEDARPVAGVEHLAEQPLQVDRLGGVEAGRARLAADPALDVREQARLPSGCG